MDKECEELLSITGKQRVAEQRESDLAHSQAFAVRAVIVSVTLLPFFIIALKFAAFIQGKDFPLDDKVLWTCLGAIGTVMAYAFKPRKL